MRGILAIHRRRETVSDIHKSNRRSSWEFIVLERFDRRKGLGLMLNGLYTALLGIAHYAERMKWNRATEATRKKYRSKRMKIRIMIESK